MPEFQHTYYTFLSSTKGTIACELIYKQNYTSSTTVKVIRSPSVGTDAGKVQLFNFGAAFLCVQPLFSDVFNKENPLGSNMLGIRHTLKFNSNNKHC